MGGAPMDLERDRRLLPRLYVRAFLATLFVVSAVALARAESVPVLAGVTPEILGTWAWLLAGLHALLGLGILVRAVRRPIVAGQIATLLGWMAFLGATRRSLPAFAVAGVLVLAAGAAPGEEEGVWKLRDRSLIREAAWLAYLGGLGLFARLLLGPGPVAFMIPLLGAWLHQRSLARLKAPRPWPRVLLLWLLVFWVGFGGLEAAVAGVRAAETTGADGTVLAWTVASGWVGGTALACFWLRTALWRWVAFAAALGGWAALFVGRTWLAPGSGWEALAAATFTGLALLPRVAGEPATGTDVRPE